VTPTASSSAWEVVWETARQEFADLPDLAGLTRLVMRVVLAALLGGALGYERETQGKDAGLRTHMLICAGSALFVAIPLQAGMTLDGASRIIQGIVTGIGFVGGGAILKLDEERRIEGLTTAAGIWLTAAIGIAAGLGREGSALIGTALALFVMHALASISRRLAREAKTNDHD
jgi:putative Mg2+ transporter-C (MgtC) family protein